MLITVLSGKGGTGKTTVSTNLSLLDKGAVLVDTDVEEPNAYIFLKPQISSKVPVTLGYPVVDMDKCDLCGKCGDFCQFNAILPAKNKVLVFKDSCHHCTGCSLVCPKNAISYGEREIGFIYNGKSIFDTRVIYGLLNINELSGVRIIENIKEIINNEKLVIIDAPPGTSCSTVAAVENTDYAIIVSEPTPFGVSDMKMVVEMLRNMKIPFSVVVNKAGLGDNEIYEYCKQENIDIIGEIPFDKRIAKLYSNGKIFSSELEEYKNIFTDIFEKIVKLTKE